MELKAITKPFNEEELYNRQWAWYPRLAKPALFSWLLGVLQDTHWSGGSFGYFHSYALCYMYVAQWKAAMDKEIPNFDELCARGELAPIREWLTEKVHKYGALKKPFELLQEGTGEGLNAKYLADYLKEKYTKLYQL